MDTNFCNPSLPGMDSLFHLQTSILCVIEIYFDQDMTVCQYTYIIYGGQQLISLTKYKMKITHYLPSNFFFNFIDQIAWFLLYFPVISDCL